MCATTSPASPPSPDTNYNGDEASFKYTSPTNTAAPPPASSTSPSTPSTTRDRRPQHRQRRQDDSVDITDTDLLSNVHDIDGGLHITGVGNATHGTVVRRRHRRHHRHTRPHYNGDASFEYTATDQHGGTTTGVVNITVNAVSDDGFEGKPVDVTYIFPTSSEVYFVEGNDVIVGDGVEVPASSTHNGYGSVDVSDDRVLITFESNPSRTWTDSSFNGPNFRRGGNVSDIVGVDILQNGNNAGLDDSRITFDAENIYINWHGLSFQEGDQVELLVHFA